MTGLSVGGYRSFLLAALDERCRLYDAPHEFNLDMQAEAWEWLRRWVSD